MQERLQELDLLRALALLGVLVIHAAAWAAPSGAAPTSGAIPALSDLARCSIPVFVLASGFALRLRHRRDDAPARFLARRAQRTLVPWFVWAALFLAVGLFATGEPASGPGHVAQWLAFGAGHLYFLLLVMQLYLVSLLLPGRRSTLALAAGAALALQLVLGALHTYAPQPAGPLGWVGGRLAYLEAPYYVGYFVVGALLAELWPRLRRLPHLLPAAAAATAAAVPVWLWTAGGVASSPAVHGTYAFLWPGRAPLVLAGSILVLAAGTAFRERFPSAPHAAANWLGTRSLGVYVSHPLALTLVGPFALGRLPDWPRLAFLVAASLAFGWGVVTVLSASRAGAIALGEAGPAPRTAKRRPATVAA